MQRHWSLLLNWDCIGVFFLDSGGYRVNITLIKNNLVRKLARCYLKWCHFSSSWRILLLCFSPVMNQACPLKQSCCTFPEHTLVWKVKFLPYLCFHPCSEPGSIYCLDFIDHDSLILENPRLPKVLTILVQSGHPWRWLAPKGPECNTRLLSACPLCSGERERELEREKERGEGGQREREKGYDCTSPSSSTKHSFSEPECNNLSLSVQCCRICRPINKSTGRLREESAGGSGVRRKNEIAIMSHRSLVTLMLPDRSGRPHDATLKPKPRTEHSAHSRGGAHIKSASSLPEGHTAEQRMGTSNQTVATRTCLSGRSPLRGHSWKRNPASGISVHFKPDCKGWLSKTIRLRKSTLRPIT